MLNNCFSLNISCSKMLLQSGNIASFESLPVTQWGEAPTADVWNCHSPSEQVAILLYFVNKTFES
ncbi:unnamed protein product [Acanthoscelides obtectus]|uniref:Uncharacterized protein n=1 Tax=Acanthoscelides obtectus TaxID=200917 RepID=A0A9P0P6A2_ACAOB|nr:unnamed protein product [Acanthoscelides obtectus]CAK1676719.1 hypothetical protein AOBTE_LOCUS30913 [Acanthoscelides obtectus]